MMISYVYEYVDCFVCYKNIIYHLSRFYYLSYISFCVEGYETCLCDGSPLASVLLSAHKVETNGENGMKLLYWPNDRIKKKDIRLLLHIK